MAAPGAPSETRLSTRAQRPVLVAGAGPAGAAAALVLARSGVPVRLLMADSGGVPPGETLPPAARPLLRDLGVLACVETAGHLQAAGTRSGWGTAQAAISDHLFDPHGHGWLLDRRRFDQDLRHAAAAAGAVVEQGAQLRGARREGSLWQVRLVRTGGVEEQLQASWLVDATGRRASVARAAGANRQREDRQVAFHARYVCPAPASDQDACTTVESVADGWWYSVRVPAGVRVVAFLTDADHPQRQALRSAAGFRQAVATTRLIGPCLRHYALEAVPQLIEACGGWLQPPAAEGWTAVGDAALSFDPLSSQGLLTALYSGLRGAESVIAALNGEGESARRHYCERLEAIRQAYQRHRAEAYASECRWRESPFWARRLEAIRH